MISAGKTALISVLVGILVPIAAVGAYTQQKKSLNGNLDVGYRVRSDGNETDQDLTQALSLEYFRPWSVLGEGAEAGIVFYGSLQQDIDDHPGDGEYDPFREIADTYKNSQAGWIYLAYAELSGGSGFLETLRVGRQESLELEPLAFDGGLASLRLSDKASVSFFGGLPANIFENNSDRNGDSVAGGYVTWRQSRDLSFIVGYLSLVDDVELLDGTGKTLRDDIVDARANWRINRATSLTAGASVLDSEFKDINLRGAYNSYERNLRLSVYYYQLFITREVETLNSDPFSILLGDYQPYYQGGFNVYKGFGERLGLEAGGLFRELTDSGDESRYNHSFQKYLFSLYIYKTPFRSSQLVVGTDIWNTDNDVSSTGWRAEYSQKLAKRIDAVAGTSYYLYKVDALDGTEDEDLRDYYAGLKMKAGKHMTLRADYSFEDGSLREIDTLEIGLNYEF